MVDSIVFKGIKVFNPLEGKIDEIIDYFVDYYGEEHRQNITEKISKTSFFFLPKLGVAQDIIEGKARDTFIEIESYLSEKQLSFEEELNLKYLPIDGLRLNADMVKELQTKLQSKEKLIKSDYDILRIFAKSIYVKPIKLLGHDKYLKWQKQEILDKINQYCEDWEKIYIPQLNQLKEETSRISEQLKQYIPALDEIQKKEEADIEDIKLQHFKRLLNSKNIEISDDVVSKYFPTYLWLQDQKRLYISLFSDEERQNCVELFKFLKMGTSNNYRDYYENTYIETAFFTAEILSDMQKRRAISYRERCHKNDLLQYALNIVDKLDIKYEKDKLNIMRSMADFGSEKTAGFVTHYVDSNNKLRFICVLEDFFSLNTSTVFHEVQHIIDSELMEDKDSCYLVKCGVDIIVHEKNGLCLEMLASSKQRKAFDEILTEYYSGQVYQNARDDKFKVGAKPWLSSSYRCGFPVFRKLIDDHEYILMRARQIEDEKFLGEYFGEKNMERVYDLAYDVLYRQKSFEAIKEICEKKGCFLDDVHKHVETKDALAWSNATKNYLDCIIRANEMDEQITNYKNAYSQDLEREI